MLSTYSGGALERWPRAVSAENDRCRSKRSSALGWSTGSSQPETVGRPGASKVGAWPIANVQPFRSTDQLWPVSP